TSRFHDQSLLKCLLIKLTHSVAGRAPWRRTGRIPAGIREGAGMSRATSRRRWLSAAFAGVVTAGLTAVGLTAAAPVAHAATIDTDAWYQLISRHSGKAIDIEGASTADAARVIQWAPTGGQNQQFRFVPSGDGYYRIMARHSGKVLDVFEWNPNDG